MRISNKYNSILLILGILIVFSSALINLKEKSNVNTNPKNAESPSNTPDTKPLTSGCWTANFIAIHHNWTTPCPYIKPGLGTSDSPHIIENGTIDAINSPIDAGILIKDSTDYFIIRNCTIRNANSDYGGICLYNTTHGRIENSTWISNNKFGIYIYNSSSNTIFDNKINGNENSGIYLLAKSYNNTIINNTLSNNNNYGVLLFSCDNNTIRGNTFEYNGWSGILISDSNKTIIYGNTINNNNDYGIWLNGACYNTIYDNTINNNVFGVLLVTYSNNNKVFNNIFVSNYECIVEDYTCTGNILTPNTCNPKSNNPYTSPSDDDDSDNGHKSATITGYDLLIVSLISVLISGIISLIFLKNRTKRVKY